MYADTPPKKTKQKLWDITRKAVKSHLASKCAPGLPPAELPVACNNNPAGSLPLRPASLTHWVVGGCYESENTRMNTRTQQPWSVSLTTSVSGFHVACSLFRCLVISVLLAMPCQRGGANFDHEPCAHTYVHIQCIKFCIGGASGDVISARKLIRHQSSAGINWICYSILLCLDFLSFSHQCDYWRDEGFFLLAMLSGFCILWRISWTISQSFDLFFPCMTI